MAEILTLPPNLPKAQNAEVGASKFCPGCGHGITLKALALAVDELGIKQKIANFLANKSLLRKIPIIDKFIIREQRLLPEKIVQEQKKDNRTEHSKFVDEVSENGKLRNLLLGQPIKNVEMKTAEQRNGELHTIADQTKIEQMRRKMDGKSMDDDL